MTLSLTFIDMLQLAGIEKLLLRTSVARVFLDTQKKTNKKKTGCLVMLAPLKEKKESEISFD